VSVTADIDDIGGVAAIDRGVAADRPDVENVGAVVAVQGCVAASTGATDGHGVNVRATVHNQD